MEPSNPIPSGTSTCRRWPWRHRPASPAAACGPAPGDRARRHPGRLGAVHVGLFDRPPGGAPTRARRSRSRPRSSRSGTPTTRSTTGTPVARSTGSTLIQGAIRGMIESLGDPYSAYLTSEEYRQSLQGISGQFEGIGARDRTAGQRRDARLRAARPGLPAGRDRAARRVAGRGWPASWPATSSSRSTATRSTA